MKNFDLRSPERTYSQLKAESVRTNVPATALSRDAIDLCLRRQSRLIRHAEIAEYANEMAGSEFDLDTALESAGTEHLIDSTTASG